MERVKVRVLEGGHDIPANVIKRRYDRGISNFFHIYRRIVDQWMIIDNSGDSYQQIAHGTKNLEELL